MKTILILTISMLAAFAPAESVRSGKGIKFHALGTNSLTTLCSRPASRDTNTNAVDCKQCQWALKPKAK